MYCKRAAPRLLDETCDKSEAVANLAANAVDIVDVYSEGWPAWPDWWCRALLLNDGVLCDLLRLPGKVRDRGMAEVKRPGPSHG